MHRIELNVMSGEQTIVPLTADEIAGIQSSIQSQPSLRIEEIRTRLTQIDIDSVRPLRAIAAGNDTQFDRDKLAALDAEADSLRLELSVL